MPFLGLPRHWSSSLVPRSHQRKVPSPPTEASRLPSGENHIAQAPPSWPPKGWALIFPSSDHRQKLPSDDPRASVLPSGEKTRLHMVPESLEPEGSSRASAPAGSGRLPGGGGSVGRASANGETTIVQANPRHTPTCVITTHLHHDSPEIALIDQGRTFWSRLRRRNLLRTSPLRYQPRRSAIGPAPLRY